MVLSGAVSAINLNINTNEMNENIANDENTIESLEFGEFSAADPSAAQNHDDLTGPLAPIAMEKPEYHESTRASYVVYDNDMANVSYLIPSYIDNYLYGWDELIADDFLMWTPEGDEWCIRDVHWQGFFYTPWYGGFVYGSYYDWEWNIVFYEDDGTGNAPGDVYAGPYTYGWDDIDTTFVMYDYWYPYYRMWEWWDMSVDLPEEVCFPGCGEKFWISIYGEGDSYWLFTYVGMRDWNIYHHEADYKSDYYGPSDWTSTGTVFGFDMDLAFQLTDKVDYDAMVVDIDVDTDDFCGCVPIVVTVGNDGKYDLEDVPVHVTITGGGGYDETILTDIGVGEEVEVAFPDFCPDDWGTVNETTLCYTIDACTELAIDMFPGNDCDSDVFCLDYPAFHDVGGVDIEVIHDGCLNYEFCGTIENFGQYEECCFKTYLTIEEWVVDVPYTELVFEQFESWPPAGWNIYLGWGEWDTWNTNLYYGRANYAGGDGMCADCDDDALPSYYGVGGIMESPVFDLSTVLNPTLEFMLSYNDISTYYSADYLWVDISTDGGWSWSNLFTYNYDVDAYGPGELVTVDLTPYSWSSSVQVRFEYDSGTYWAWWAEVDDFKVSAPEVGHWEEVWSTWYCVDTIDPCEQLEFCFEETWTPEIGEDCTEVEYRATIETELCDPMDEVPGNDAYSETFTVAFIHDVAVDITQPQPAKAVTWVGLDNGVNGNAIGLTAGGTWEFAIRFLASDLAAYDGWGITDMRFYNGYLSNPQTPKDCKLKIYDEGTPASPGALLYEESFSTPSMNADYFYLTLASSILIDGTKEMWVSIEVTHAAGEFPAGCDTGPAIPGQGLWANLGSGWQDLITYFNNVWMINIGADADVSPVPGVDVWVGCGEQEICADIINEGVFDEVDDPDTVCFFEGIIVYYEIYQYIWTDPCEEPEMSMVFDGMEELELPCGETETICFTYDFTIAGVYQVFVWAELFEDFEDCDPDDNIDDVVLGVDCCPPESEHTLTPLQPSGCNNWYTEQVTVTITADDPLCPDPCYGTSSGLKEIHYIINGVETVKEDDSATFKLSDEGVNLVEYWAVDEAGNEEDHMTFEVAIDTVKPTVDLIYEKIEDGTLQVKFTAVAVDSTSGIQKVEFYIGTELKQTLLAPPFTWTITWEDSYKTATFKAIAYDGACNTGEDTVFGGDIPGAKTYANTQAHSHSQPHTHSATTQQV
jgi:hypothetical protein